MNTLDRSGNVVPEVGPEVTPLPTGAKRFALFFAAPLFAIFYAATMPMHLPKLLLAEFKRMNPPAAK